MIPYVDPKVRFWLGLAFSIAGAIAGGSMVIKGAVPDSWVPYILAWAGIIAFFGNVLLTALNAAASTTSSRAMSAASDPAVNQVVMYSADTASGIPSSKVV